MRYCNPRTRTKAVLYFGLCTLVAACNNSTDDTPVLTGNQSPTLPNDPSNPSSPPGNTQSPPNVEQGTTSGNLDVQSFVGIKSDPRTVLDESSQNNTIQIDGLAELRLNDTIRSFESSSLKLEFKSTSEGALHAIAVGQSADDAANATRFKIYGSDDTGNRSADFTYNGSGDYQEIIIPIGEDIQGDSLHVFLINEDSPESLANSSWRNLSITYQPSADCMTPEMQTLLDEHNKARATARQCGDRFFEAAPPLTWSCQLATASQKHSEDMARNNYFAHNSQDGRTPFQRMSAEGYNFSTAGENIAAGNNTPQATTQQWINSPGHCSNMMNPNYTEMGGGVAYNANSSYRSYWTVNLARPR